jgi:hypothetical protein
MKPHARRVFEILPAVLLLAGLTSTARAQGAEPTSWYFPPGMSACSAQVQASDVFFNAYANNMGTWTVEISSTPTGPTQTIFTHVGDVNDELLKPPTAGMYFWRLCVQNTSKYTISFEMQFGGGGAPPKNPAPPTLQSGLTATLPPNGVVCGPETSSTANRVGTSTVPVQWFDQNYDGDGNQIGGNYPGGNFDYVTTTSLNDFVSLSAGSYTLVMCVQNTSASSATVNFNLLGGS